MEEKIKQRLIGVLVVIGSLFIILPFLFHNSRPSAQEKIASTVPNGTTPPAVSVTLPAENTATPNTGVVTQSTTEAKTTASPSVPTPAANAATAVAATPASPSVASTQPVQPAQEAVQPASQTQKLQTTAQVTATAAKIEPMVMVSASSEKLNSNTIASHPDASGFKPDEAVSPTSGLTTGIPISTPSTTEAVTSSSAPTNNQAVPAAQPAAANTQTQSTTESAPKHIVAHHKKTVKTAHHPHHKMHAMNGKKWEIQLAVFSNEHNAKQLMAKLHAHHFAAHMRRITHDGRHMTAVFVGPEFNHHKTLAMQNHLHHEFHLSGVVKQV